LAKKKKKKDKKTKAKSVEQTCPLMTSTIHGGEIALGSYLLRRTKFNSKKELCQETIFSSGTESGHQSSGELTASFFLGFMVRGREGNP
jgi:hypothetical protein